MTVRESYPPLAANTTSTRSKFLSDDHHRMLLHQSSISPAAASERTHE